MTRREGLFVFFLRSFSPPCPFGAPHHHRQRRSQLQSSKPSLIARMRRSHVPLEAHTHSSSYSTLLLHRNKHFSCTCKCFLAYLSFCFRWFNNNISRCSYFHLRPSLTPHGASILVRSLSLSTLTTATLSSSAAHKNPSTNFSWSRTRLPVSSPGPPHTTTSPPSYSTSTGAKDAL